MDAVGSSLIWAGSPRARRVAPCPAQRSQAHRPDSARPHLEGTDVPRRYGGRRRVPDRPRGDRMTTRERGSASGISPRRCRSAFCSGLADSARPHLEGTDVPRRHGGRRRVPDRPRGDRMTTRERGSASGFSPRRCRSAFCSGLAAGPPCRVAASLTAQQPEKPGEGLTRWVISGRGDRETPPPRSIHERLPSAQAPPRLPPPLTPRLCPPR